MDKERAKLILSGGVPRDLDAEQEGIRRARDIALTDPEVGAWVDRQQELTEALHAKLNELPVPSELKNRIMAGESVSRGSRFWSARRPLLAMAAGLVLLVGLAAGWFWGTVGHQERTFAGFRADMGSFLSGYFRLELQSRRLDKLTDHLAAKHSFTDYHIPEVLTGISSVGCRSIAWHDTEVALICFDVDGELVHFMVLPKDQLQELPPRFGAAQEGEWATTGWADERNVYLVATRGDARFLRELMAGRHPG